MIEQNNHRKFFSEEQSPVPVPPVEEAWTSMKEKLDAELPVSPWQRVIKFVSHHSPRVGQILLLKTWAFIGTSLAICTIILLSRLFITKNENPPSAPLLRTNAKTHQRPPSNNETIGGKMRNDSGLVNRSFESSSMAGRSNLQQNSLSYESGEDSNFKSGIKGANFHQLRSGSLEKQINNSYPDGTGDGHSSGRNSITREQNMNSNQDLMLQTEKKKATRFALLNEAWIIRNSSTWQNPSSVFDSLIRKNGKLVHSNFSQVGKSKEVLDRSGKSKSAKSGIHQRGSKNLSVGIEIKKTFPLGEQETSAYNINAKENLLSDYIPAPYFKFHVNNKVYFEAALHINSPQYVRSSPIESQSDSLTIPTGPYTTKTTSVILNKLYYFDIPIIFHYRTWNHFYLGTGLQFSALSGGVGTEDTRLIAYNGAPDSVTSSSISLKNNPTAYGQLKKLDLRLLLDANYQWRRFTMGIRYQQALASYLKTPTGGSGSGERNSAFGVYLQYDIWRKK